MSHAVAMKYLSASCCTYDDDAAALEKLELLVASYLKMGWSVKGPIVPRAVLKVGRLPRYIQGVVKMSDSVDETAIDVDQFACLCLQAMMSVKFQTFFFFRKSVRE